MKTESAMTKELREFGVFIPLASHYRVSMA
jgi:hypothetical protein